MNTLDKVHAVFLLVSGVLLLMGAAELTTLRPFVTGFIGGGVGTIGLLKFFK